MWDIRRHAGVKCDTSWKCNGVRIPLWHLTLFSTQISVRLHHHCRLSFATTFLPPTGCGQKKLLFSIHLWNGRSLKQRFENFSVPVHLCFCVKYKMNFASFLIKNNYRCILYISKNLSAAVWAKRKIRFGCWEGLKRLFNAWQIFYSVAFTLREKLKIAVLVTERELATYWSMCDRAAGLT